MFWSITKNKIFNAINFGTLSDVFYYVIIQIVYQLDIHCNKFQNPLLRLLLHNNTISKKKSGMISFVADLARGALKVVLSRFP